MTDPAHVTVETRGTPESTTVAVNGKKLKTSRVSSSVKTAPDGSKVVNVVVWTAPPERPVRRS